MTRPIWIYMIIHIGGVFLLLKNIMEELISVLKVEVMEII